MVMHTNSDRRFMRADVTNGIGCPHIDRYIGQDLPTVKIDSPAFKKQVANSSLQCDSCEMKMPRLWVCLHSRCRAVVCSSSTVTHMRTHFEEKHREDKKSSCHSIYVNPRTLGVWCYSCAAELNPFDKDAILSAEARNYLKTIVRCLQGKRSKSQQSNDVPGLVGLRNLGNTCYASAALQCLSNTPALTNFFNYCDKYIPQYVNTSRRPKYKLAEKFHEFTKAMWSGNSPIYAPVQLIDEIKKYNEVFRDHSQQDSVEFLRVVLDKLHEELPYPPSALANNSNITSAHSIVSNNFTNDDVSPTTSISHDSITDDHYKGCGTHSFSSSTTTKDSEKHRRKHPLPTSVISNIFQGHLESRIKCSHCNQEFFKEERFYDLPIQIDKKFRPKSLDNNSDDSVVNSMVGLLGGWLGIGGRTLRLQDCLSAFCATENLTGRDKYRCDRCKKLRDCHKTLRITRLPETLCIQLKRFRYSSYISKIGTHVQFPMEGLDMRPYCKNSSLEDTGTEYNLYGFIHHRGGSGSGHYIAYAKNPIDGNWYEYDDTYVTKKSITEISRLEAYVLFYRRTSIEKETEREKILDKIKKDLSTERFWISRLWFNRWQFMMTPGPISNYDFICPHGSVHYENYAKLRDMVVKVPPSVYTILAERYGTDGSPLYSAANYGTSDCMICQQEEILLSNRRRKESRDINELDARIIGRGEHWYLISETWLQTWHTFTAGGPLPGPISNITLLMGDGRPRLGMKRGVDFRGVNSRVWNYFKISYGGGPAVVRASIDLYAPPVFLTPN